MTEERLFEMLVNTPVAERAGVLDRVCGADAALRGRLEALLAADGTHLREPPTADAPRGTAADPDATRPSPDAVGAAGEVIGGRYKLVERIGEGGMGEVWMAQQTAPVRRAVAVKLIKPGMDSKAVLARFEAERQALALMDHPNIARVFDGGVTADGRPYFAMELVKGIPITKFCDDRRLTPVQRLGLFVQVCQAVQHAHQKGVIHRDLKPGNVLVALYDDRPVPKVIDFGVAKATGAALTDRTLMTGFGAVVGTPEYMSPEQASFNAVDVDTRSDVYALGVILYELLTGSTPVDRKSLRQAAVLEILRIVREVDPPRPSAKLSTADALPTISANRGVEPKALTGLLRSELDWVVMKALEKDRSRRYDTANGLAADVQRYLSGEPVQAHPPGAGYRLKKFIARHRGPVAAAAVVGAAVLLGFAGTGVGLVEAQRQAVRAEQAADQEREQRKLAEDRQAKLELKQGELEDEQAKLKVRTQEAEDARRDADLELHDNQRVLLRAAWDAGDTARMKKVLDQMRPKPGRPDRRGFETHYLDRLTHAEVDRRSVDIPPDGQGLTVADWWAPGRLQYRVTPTANQHYHTITAFDLATGKPADGFTPITVRWNSGVQNPLVYALPGDPPRVWASAPVPPAAQLELGGLGEGTMLPQRDIQVWDARTGKSLVHCTRLLPDPALAAEGWRHRFPNLQYLGETADRDATRVVAQLVREAKGKGGLESRAVIHDLTTGRAVLTLDPVVGVLDRAQFTFDDKQLVTSHRVKGPTDKISYLFTVWDAATGQRMTQYAPDEMWRGFTRDGLAVGFGKDTLGLTPGGRWITPAPDAGELTYFRPTGRWAVATRPDARLEVRDARTGLLLDTLPAAGRPTAGASNPTRQWETPGGGSAVMWNDGRRVSEYRSPRAEVVRVPSAAECHWQVGVTADGRLRPVAAVYGAAKSAAGGGFVTNETKELLWFDPEAMQLRRVNLSDAPAGKRVVQHSELAAAGRTLVVMELESAAGGAPGAPRQAFHLGVYDAETGRRRCAATLSEVAPRPSWPPDRPTRFVLSADGSRVAGVDPAGGRLVCLNTDTGAKVWAVPLPKAGCTRPPLFLPDGSQVVVCDDAGTLHVFDAGDGRAVKQVAGGPKMTMGLEELGLTGPHAQRVTPDGRTLYFSSIDGHTLTLFDTTDWAVRHTLKVDKGVWGEVGDRFALVRTEADAEVWDLFVGKPVGRFEWPKPGWGQVLSVRHCVFDRDGTRAFVLTDDAVRVFDIPRGHEVLALPLSEERSLDSLPLGETLGPGHLSLNPEGTELTVLRFYRDRGAVLKRVFDARPLTADELAHGKRLDALPPPKPLPPPQPVLPAAKPPVTASDFFDVAVRSRGKDAVDAYRTAIKLDPDFPVLRRRLAALLESQGDLDGAIAMYKEAIKLDRRDFTSWFQIGALLERRQDHRGAAEAFREALAADDRPPTVAEFDTPGAPTRLALYNSLAYHLRECGELAEAEKVFRDGLKLLDGEAALRAAVEQWPRPGVVAGNFAVCLLRQGKKKEAEEMCEALVGRLTALIPKGEKPDAEPARRPTMHAAGMLSDIANELVWAGQYAEAVVWSDRAIEKWTEYRKRWPGDPQAAALQQVHWRKAVALNWMGKGKEAVAAIDESIKLSPDTDRPYQKMMRARYVAKTGDHAEAVKAVKAEFGQGNTNYWDAALAYSLCAKAAKGDEKLREEYAKEAVALLRKTLDGGGTGYPWKTDADLDPVRERDDFKQVLVDLEKKLAPPKPEK